MAMVMVVGVAVTLMDQAEAGLHERRLLNDLFMYHDPRERPVRNESDSVQMQLGVKWVAAQCAVLTVDCRAVCSRSWTWTRRTRS